MLLLGIDIGTSFIKVSVVDAVTQRCLSSVRYPEKEVPIISEHPGWAEQSPDTWWNHTRRAILKAHAEQTYDPKDIGAIGITYQMHGLVVVNEEGRSLRNSIIWCDSRAVAIGENAFNNIGKRKCLSTLLNSPGNFTASKLAWLKQNEPSAYKKTRKVMLPGDFIAMKLTGDVTTSIAALSEGIFWNFKKDILSKEVFRFFGFDEQLIPPIQPVFSTHGEVKEKVARALWLKPGIPVTFKAGDQPVNALSLNVFEPNEFAASAGTSGVIYGVTDKLEYDVESRINSFAHVNYMPERKRIGVLLCINGTGVLNRWVKSNVAQSISYSEMNKLAAKVDPGSQGLLVLPFGNGAERMFGNKIVGSHFNNIDLNIHTQGHVYRAVQEGIACAFRYGLDIMRSIGLRARIIRAGKSNLFLSEVFASSFVNTTGIPVEVYSTDGSFGAALGAGMGIGYYRSSKEAFSRLKPEKVVEPQNKDIYEGLYQNWRKLLEEYLKRI